MPLGKTPAEILDKAISKIEKKKKEIYQAKDRDGEIQPGHYLSSVCMTCSQKRYSEEQGYNAAIEDCIAVLNKLKESV